MSLLPCLFEGAALMIAFHLVFGFSFAMAVLAIFISAPRFDSDQQVWITASKPIILELKRNNALALMTITKKGAERKVRLPIGFALVIRFRMRY